MRTFPLIEYTPELSLTGWAQEEIKAMQDIILEQDDDILDLRDVLASKTAANEILSERCAGLESKIRDLEAVQAKLTEKLAEYMNHDDIITFKPDQIISHARRECGLEKE